MALLQSIEDKTFAAQVKMLQHNVAELNGTMQAVLAELRELRKNQVINH